MDRDIAVALLDQLHAAQNEFYGGGGDALLRDLLASDIAWTAPGNNSIAGVYRGTEAVFDYFRRRDLAAGTFRMTRRDVLAGEGDRIAALTDGATTIDGMELFEPSRNSRSIGSRCRPGCSAHRLGGLRRDEQLDTSRPSTP